MLEKKIQKKITDYLKSKGIYIVKVINGTRAGVPDIIGCYNGQFIGIEVKTPSTKTNVSPLQKYNLNEISKAKGISLVAWDLEQVKELIEGLE